jgi:hypothetical protein
MPVLAMASNLHNSTSTSAVLYQSDHTFTDNADSSTCVSVWYDVLLMLFLVKA